ncbi:MAG: PKD domain-containing protein [Candidatus Omnitrophota bacterium]
MYLKRSFLIISAIFFASLFIVRSGFCYRVPTEESNIRYLYVFGQDGKKTYGAVKTQPQIVFLKVPASYTGKIEISIYDPDVGGSIDEKSDKWNTKTKFSIYGGSKAYSSLADINQLEAKDFSQGVALDTETFGENSMYDKSSYHFTPIDADKGEKIGDFRYFKIVAEGLEGDDNNLFALDITPDDSEAFSYMLALRLSETRGAKMALYPLMPSDAASVIEHNYDLDSNGGWIELISPTKSFNVSGSGTGIWENTKIDLSADNKGKKWVYEITKDRQQNANMAMHITTDKGLAVPVYFTKGEKGPKRVFVERPKPAAPVKEEPWMESKLSCNSFTFDAAKSYDPDDQELSYLWDFGDGTTSDQVRTMHTYKDAGKYLVKLTVTDSSDAECNSATTQQVIKVNQPPCAVASGPEISCVNDELVFDGSQSTDSPEDKLTYRWNFGDGETAEGVKVKHRYAKGGRYQVTLTVMDNSGSICDTGVDKLNVSVNTAPVADAGKEEVFLCRIDPNESLAVTLDASGSKDLDGDALTYTWDFGDGETGEGKVITHVYKKGGRYIAKLTVTDNTDTNCNKASAVKAITVNRAPIAKAGSDINTCLTEEINFDASGSLDSDGDALAYTWDFGDGEKASGKKVAHKYAKGGVYQVKLAVDDGTGTDCSANSDKILVNVNTPPAAAIASKDKSSVGQGVNFDGGSSADSDGDRLAYTWDFGDGTTGSGVNAKHVYSKGGLYKVTLVVDDQKSSECSSSTASHYLKINTPPVADVGPDMACCVNEIVDFDGSRSSDADGDMLTYKWDFGDGETADGIKVKHAYKKVGTYKVVLTVTDNSGTELNSSAGTFVATVNAEPVPLMEIM